MNARRITHILILTFIVLTVGCNRSGRQAGDDEGAIVVSILPLKYIVTQITGGDHRIEVLVPDGASPETYEPTPSQMVDVTDAVLMFSTGLLDFERSLNAKIGNDNAKMVDLSRGLDLIQGVAHSHGDGHVHIGADPHVWLSIRNLKTMSKTVYEHIAALYPDSSKYSHNYRALIEHLDSVDAQIKTITAASEAKYFLIYHPALTYAARDYGLVQVSLEQEGKEPSAAYLKEIISASRRDGTSKILYQKQFSPTVVESVARQVGARCVQIDPLREDVPENLVEIVKIIVAQ